ncbi:MAG: hypothetical protein ACTSRP_24940, partial [Candidatus Helarchaeota archaeon]
MRIRKWAIWVIATIMLISFLISVVFLPYVPFKNKFLENKDTGILIGKTQSVLIIENYTIIKTDTVINKSILIRGNGTLDLRANLTINSTFKYEHNITIQNNGTLLLNSGAINSTNWTCIYTYHNSSVLLRNHSKIELKNIILNASGILKINDSYMNANLMGYISEILLIESLVNISNSNNLTSLFNIICESLFGINSNVLISGENNVFNVSAKNITLFSMNFRTDNGIDMSGANSTIFLNATEFCNLTYSIFKIYGGNSTNGNNGGNSKIIVKGYGIYIQNTSILGQQGVNKKTSENGSSIILINARQILFINESDFYSLIGNITLNSSEIIIKKSEFFSDIYLVNYSKCDLTVNDSIINLYNFMNISAVYLITEDVSTKNITINAPEIRLNINNTIDLEDSIINSNIISNSSALIMTNSSIDTNKPADFDGNISLYSRMIFINNSKIKIIGKNSYFKINSFINMSLNNLLINCTSFEGENGGNSTLIFNSTYNLTLTNSFFINKGGNGEKNKGNGIIRFYSQMSQFNECIVYNKGGDMSIGTGGQGGNASIELKSDFWLGIYNSVFRNIGGTNEIDIIQNVVGDSLIAFSSKNITFHNFTCINLGGNGTLQSGGQADINITCNNLDATICNFTNHAGKSKMVDNIEGKADFILNIQNILRFYRVIITNYGGLGGSSDNYIPKGGDGGYSNFIISSKNGTLQSVSINNSQIKNFGGNGGNCSHIIGNRGGYGGFSNLQIESSRIILSNNSFIFNKGGDGGLILVNTTNDKVNG